MGASGLGVEGVPTCEEGGDEDFVRIVRKRCALPEGDNRRLWVTG